MTRTKLAKPKVKIVPVIMCPVESSAVKSVGWYNNVMYVQYLKGNAIYQFEGIDISGFENIRCAESVNKAILATGIKGTKFEQ